MSEQSQGTDHMPQHDSAEHEPTSDQAAVRALPDQQVDATGSGSESTPTDTAPVADTMPDVPSPNPSTVPIPGDPGPAPVVPEPVEPTPEPGPVEPPPTPEPVEPTPTPEPGPAGETEDAPSDAEAPAGAGTPTTEAETSATDGEAAAAETETPTAETETPAAEPDTPAAETETPAAEPDAPAADPEAPAAEAEAPAAQAAAAPPKPAAPKPGPIPSPAALAGRRPAVTPVVPAAATPVSTSDSITFGRVAEDGTVYVRDGDEERAVGSYPETTPEEALAYFARKYDELAANTLLLEQRLEQTELSAHEARESLKTLRDQIGEANVVGDLPALRERVAKIELAVKERQRTETERRAQAKAEATAVREALVVEAESLAAADVHQIQWKSASAKMRGMLDEWRSLQKKGPKLDKDVENALWHRLSSARSAFDKARKAFFSELDTQHAEAKRVKEKLVAEAEALSTSKDWGPTAGAFKRLMQDWRRAGRAQRADDDALWERFKTAQDAFFNAKDAVVAAENEEFRANLAVKEELLKEAEALLPVTDLEAAKSQLRTIQEKWDEAGKVPREDMSRIEGRLRKVEQAVRDLEDAKWARTNPELNARAQSMVDQLERAVQGLEQDLEAAKASGDERKIAEAQAALDARRQWLDSARGGLSEFGG